MVVPDTKFEPLTVKVKAGPPCVPVFGEIDAIAGTGFVAGGGGVGLSPPQPKRLSAAIKVSAKKVGTPA